MNRNTRLRLAKLAIQCCPELHKLAKDKSQLIKAIRNINTWLPRYLDKCERKLGRKADRLYDKAKSKYPDKVTKDGFRRAFCLLALLFLISLPIYNLGPNNPLVVSTLSVLEEFFSLLSVEYNCWIEYQILFNVVEQGSFAIHFRSQPNIIRKRFWALMFHVTNAISYRIVKESKLKWLVLLINSIRHAAHNLRTI